MSGWMLMDSTDGWLHWVKFKATLESWTVPCREQSYDSPITYVPPSPRPSYPRLSGIRQLIKGGRHQVRPWLRCVRSVAGLSVGQFARCQSNDRYGYATRDIPDGRTDRTKDGHANKAFFSFYFVKNAQQLERSSRLVTQKYEVSRRTEKNHDNSQLMLHSISPGVSLINPNIAKKREFKSETPSTSRSLCQALFTAVIRLPPHTSGSSVTIVVTFSPTRLYHPHRELSYMWN